MNRLLTLLFCCLVSNVLLAQTTLLPYGASWKYNDAGTTPTAQSGIEWYENAYDDTAWSNGNTHMGYGDGDETTTTASIYTLYTRHSFNVSNPSNYGALTLNLTYNDGAIVYINGIEVWRINMASGAIDYNTFAENISDNNAQLTQVINNNLVAGNNLIAVEIHQSNATSSDLSFDFELVAAPPPIIPIGSDWKYLDDGSDQGTAWSTLGFNDASWATGTAQLGYGDGDEATVVSYGNFSFNKHITTYFRKEFTIANASTVQALTINLLRDDGAVVYINGIEVVRDNMTGGSINYNTWASTSVSGSDEDAFWTFQVCNDNILVNGTNVIAVEIHQNNITSSDISFDLELVDAGSNTPTIVRGPYLQKGTSNSVVVRWRTSVPIASVINYGTDPNNLTQQIALPNCSTDHEIELTGLNPFTTYYYELEHDAGVFAGQTNQVFTTSPVIGTQQKIRAWVLGDCGTANNNQRAVRDAYYNYEANLPAGDNHTDMVLFLGDNAYQDGTDAEYQNAIFENMYEDMLKQTVSWSCVGNHDGHTANTSSQTGPYFDIFTFPTAGEAGGIASGTEAYYSFDYGNIHFIVLESHQADRSTSGAMYNWCESDIQNTLQDWIVCLWHHPPYTKGSHDSDIEPNLFQMRQNFLPMLENNGVDLVLCGHSHSYERSRFLNGHHGLSFSFDAADHTVGTNGNLSGKEDFNETYVKTTTGTEAGKGAVYITAGSSGKISGGSLNHPAMFSSLNALGSCILEVDTDTLRLKFLRETGTIDDYFTIIKDGINVTTINWTNMPMDTTIECSAPSDINVLGSAMATTSCPTGGLQVTYTDSIVLNGCQKEIYRLWSATDSCGSTLNYTQTIIAIDTIPPVVNITITNDTITTNIVPDYTVGPIPTDACDLQGIGATQSPAAGSTITQGDHVITLTYTDFCNNTTTITIDLNVDLTSSISTVNKNEVQVYPNPSEGIFFLELDNPNETSIMVYSLDGKLVHQEQLSGQTTYRLDLGHLTKGSYTLKISNQNRQLTKTIVLQ